MLIWQWSFIRWWYGIHQGCPLLPCCLQSPSMHSRNCRQVQVRSQRAEPFISVHSIGSTFCSETVLAVACVGFYLWAFACGLLQCGRPILLYPSSDIREKLPQKYESASFWYVLTSCLLRQLSSSAPCPILPLFLNQFNVNSPLGDIMEGT